MSMPQPNPGENSKDFISRCMNNASMKQKYPDTQDRIVECLDQTKASLIQRVCDIIDYSDYAENDDHVEELTISNLIIPSISDYIDVGEIPEDLDLYSFSSEYQGRKVTLNKPFRTSNGPKKFAVYVKNEKGTVVIVRFGDPNMKIKKNIPARRKSFRARHNCENPGPKWKSRYWACKSW